jgi:homoserine acetyltransferase
MLNYRSTEEFNSRFSTIPSNKGYKNDVEYYLQHQANKFTHFNPLCYLTLSKSMDLMDISMVMGDWSRSVHRMGNEMVTLAHDLVTTPSTDILPPDSHQKYTKETEYMLLGIKEDELIPYDELQQLGQSLGRYASIHYETVSSIYGHDAFLIDVKKFAPRLGNFLLPPPCDLKIDSDHITLVCSQENPKHYSGHHALNRYLKAIND